MVPKVLKLDQRVLPVFVHHSLHELINQLIVGLGAIPLLVQAHVQRILEESLIGVQEQTCQGWSCSTFPRLHAVCRKHTYTAFLPHCLCQRLSPQEDISQVWCRHRQCTDKVFQRGCPFHKHPGPLILKYALHQLLLLPTEIKRERTWENCKLSFCELLPIFNWTAAK